MLSLLSRRPKYNIDGLINAAKHGRLEDVKQHLQNGVDVDGKDRESTVTMCVTSDNSSKYCSVYL